MAGIDSRTTRISRCSVVFGVAGALASPAILYAAEEAVIDASSESDRPVRRTISSFRTHDWRDHFETLGVGIIISDTTTRVLQHWTETDGMRLYPTSVPLTDDLTRRGYTKVVEKRENPSWAPTPAMRKRNPEWPPLIKGGAPDNPLGTRARYLSWQYYRIHGTQDTRKIGRRASNGCIGLYNEDIEEVFERTPTGTQVRLI